MIARTSSRLQHREARHPRRGPAGREQAHQILVSPDRQELARAQIDAVDLVAVRAMTGRALPGVQAGAGFDHEMVGLGLLILRGVLRGEAGGERENDGRPEERTVSVHDGRVVPDRRPLSRDFPRVDPRAV